MSEHNVTFELSNEQEARLLAITRRFNVAADFPMDAEELLTSVLTVDVRRLIDERLNGFDAALTALEASDRGGCEACEIS